MQTREQKPTIESADGNYINAVFEALMNFQAIEILLKKCILKSYEIIESSCPNGVSFRPSKSQIKAIENKLGLGGLVEKFREITDHHDLCDRIKETTKVRNSLAHRAAAKYLDFTISESGAIACQAEAEQYQNAADEANKLYYELREILNQIEEIHGQIV